LFTPAGLNIYPEDLEAALRRQPEVKDCVVVGMDRGGMRSRVPVVILRSDVTVEEVVGPRESIAGGLSHACGCGCDGRRNDFPRTSTQKPRRNVIAEFAAKQILQGAMGNAATISRDGVDRRITGRKPAASEPAAAMLDSGLGIEFAGSRGS